MRQNIAYTYWLEHDHEEKFLSGTAGQVRDLMLRTWAHPDAVRDERIVEDICRFPAALRDIMFAKGAKVVHLDNRRGRRQSKWYKAPRIEAVEEYLQARYERFDPVPVATPTTVPVLPPKKRRRCVYHFT